MRFHTVNFDDGSKMVVDLDRIQQIDYQTENGLRVTYMDGTQMSVAFHNAKTIDELIEAWTTRKDDKITIAEVNALLKELIVSYPQPRRGFWSRLVGG